MLNQLLSTQTFCDHANEPSFGRKACFWILLGMGILAILALSLVAFGPAATGKSVSSLTLEIIKAGVTLCGLFYGAAQVSKGLAQMGKGPLPVTPNMPVPSMTPAMSGASLQPSSPPVPVQPGNSSPATIPKLHPPTIASVIMGNLPATKDNPI